MKLLIKMKGVQLRKSCLDTLHRMLNNFAIPQSCESSSTCGKHISLACASNNIQFQEDWNDSLR